MTGGRPAHEEPLIQRVLQPFRSFAQTEASSGILLLAATVLALAWANSPLAGHYFGLWETKLGISLGEVRLSKSLLHWINDGLMAIFFFVVGLEIKRELLVGELSSARKAALPAIAALGGMIVPAVIYLLVNAQTPAAVGWGVPMATDIAFALGVLALLGSRAPLSLKVFLAALAIIDDIGAVLVIALFYTAQIHWLSLLAGAVLLGILFAVNWMGIRAPLMYASLGVVLWLAILESGIHATVAGVLLAMTIPVAERIHRGEFTARGMAILGTYESSREHEAAGPIVDSQQAALQELDNLVDDVRSPLQRFEGALHPWVAYLIIPVFALANAGVPLASDFVMGLAHPVSFGIAAGLAIGKPLGIIALTWLAVRSGLASLPSGLRWQHVAGAGWLGGIGFTMALFIASLAFGDTPLLSLAKLGILGGSLVAGVAGFVILRRVADAEGNKAQ